MAFECYKFLKAVCSSGASLHLSKQFVVFVYRFESSCATCSTADGLVHTSTEANPADHKAQKKVRAKLTSVFEDKCSWWWERRKMFQQRYEHTFIEGMLSESFSNTLPLVVTVV